LNDAALSPHRALRRNLQPRKIKPQLAAPSSSDASAAPRLASKIMPQATNYAILGE